MANACTLQSFIGGRWIGTDAAQALKSAIDGHIVAHTHADQLDFAEAVAFARHSGVPELMKLDFQTRAQILKALGKYLMERKEQLYAISHHSGATRVPTSMAAAGKTRAAPAPCSPTPAWAAASCPPAT